MINFIEEFGYYENFVYRERKPSNRLVEGVGINDSPFLVEPTIAGKKVRHPAYSTWKNMLERSFNLDFKNRHPAYADVTCCDDWLLFTNFAKWFKNNYVSGYHLDKDILVKDNKVYSPDTCIFVPKEVNLFLILRDSCRGLLPIGVSAKSVKYVSQIGDNKHKKHLGYFDTKEQAHQAWQKAKLEQAIAFNFPPLQRVIYQLTYDIENNLETKTL